MLDQPGHPEGLASRVSVLVLLAAFAVVNAVLRAAAQRRLSQVRAVARVAQSAVMREVPTTVTAGRLASRYLSAAAEAQVGGDLLEVVSSGGRSRWLIGDTRGKGLPAVRLASLAMTSFRDACAQPGLALTEIARVVDQSVTRAVGDEGFVTAVFAEFDPRGWLQLVTCGHPPPLRLAADGSLRTLAPNAYATPLGLHPDIQPTTFSVGAGDRLLFYTDGLLEARDRGGRFFRLEDCADTLRKPDLEAAADELLGRLMAHTGRRLEDDIALLLFEASPSPVPVGARAEEPSVRLRRTPVTHETGDQGAHGPGDGLPGHGRVWRARDEHGAPGQGAKEQPGDRFRVVDLEPAARDSAAEDGGGNVEGAAFIEFREPGQAEHSGAVHDEDPLHVRPSRDVERRREPAGKELDPRRWHHSHTARQVSSISAWACSNTASNSSRWPRTAGRGPGRDPRLLARPPPTRWRSRAHQTADGPPRLRGQRHPRLGALTRSTIFFRRPRAGRQRSLKPPVGRYGGSQTRCGADAVHPYVP